MVYDFRTLVSRSSDPSFVSLFYKKLGMQLQNSEQLIDRSGRLNPKIFPNFMWLPHCRKRNPNISWPNLPNHGSQL